MKNIITLIKSIDYIALSLDNYLLEFWDSKPGWYAYYMYSIKEFYPQQED